MAFSIKKYCDNPDCRKLLGGEKPFVQTKYSVSDQYEPGDGKVEFRYLTKGEWEETHTFCDDHCEHLWREDQRSKKQFTNRDRIAQ